MARLFGSGRRSTRRQVIFYVLLTAIVLGVAGGAFYSIYHTSTAAAGVERTVTVERGIVQESVSASGNITPVDSDALSFETSGTVSAIKVSAGQSVKAGQVLATLDPAQDEIDLQSAQASLETAQETLADAEQGGTASQVAQSGVTLSQQDTQLTEDEQALSADETTLNDAEQQLSADEALGCPPSSSSAASTGSTGNSGSTGSGSTGASGSGGSGSSGASGGEGADASHSPTSTTTTTTAPTSPQASTESASVMTTSAELNGTVNPDGAATSYYFQYGTTTAYGSRTATASAGSGSTSVSVSASVTGLAPATSYIFRLVAVNSVGTSYGSAEFLTTSNSSCVVDQQTITTDQQTVQHQQAAVSQQEATISATEDGNVAQPGTIAADEAQVAQAQLTVNMDKQTVSETKLVSPISGVVTAVNGTVGGSASGSGSSGTGSSGTGSTGSGTGGSDSSADTGSSDSSSSSGGFITVESLKDLEVVAGFAEADATNIAVGQPATVTLAALPDTEVAGKVIAVSDVSTVVSNVVTYDETILLENAPSDVMDGMTADVSVVVATASNVLEVPSAAITTTGAISTVTVKHGDSTTVTRVTTGLVGDSTTEITSGVTAGEVLVEPTATVSPTTGSSTTGGGFRIGGGGGGGGFFGGGG